MFPGRRRLASVGADGAFRLWELATETLLRTVKVCDEPLSPDGRHLATCHWDDVLRLWNLGKKQLDAEFKRHEVGVADVLFPHDGQTLFSASQNGIIRTWYVKHGRLCGVLFDPARKRCKRVLSSEYHCDSGSLGRWLSQRPADFVDAILRRVK